MGLNSAKPKPPLARFIQSRARVLAMLSLLGLLLPLISSLMPHQILLSHHWAVETAQVLENPGSDHRALFAQLRLNSVQPSP